jgi:sugar phosphate isomerase/epimerase
MTSSYPPVGIGHLTMLDVAPPEWVSLAAQAGFDAVGIRTAAVGPTEEPWPMAVGSPMFTETLNRLADTGILVLDVELIRLTPDTDPTAYEQLFDGGARLGAGFVNVMADDPELERVRDNFHALAQRAEPYGLRPVIEPMAYVRVRSLADAVFVAKGSGGGVTIDPLHLRRFGATLDEVRAVDRDLLLYYQLCDAPLEGPAGLPRPDSLPRGQSVDGIPDAQLEARALRLLPGEGELPLEEIVAAMPDDIPVSVEAPNLPLRDELGALEYARRARAAVDTLLSARGAAP